MAASPQKSPLVIQYKQNTAAKILKIPEPITYPFQRLDGRITSFRESIVPSARYPADQFLFPSPRCPEERLESLYGLFLCRLRELPEPSREFRAVLALEDIEIRLLHGISGGKPVGMVQQHLADMALLLCEVFLPFQEHLSGMLEILAALLPQPRLHLLSHAVQRIVRHPDRMEMIGGDSRVGETFLRHLPERGAKVDAHIFDLEPFFQGVLQDGGVEAVGAPVWKDGEAFPFGQAVDDHLKFRARVAAELVDGDGFVQCAGGRTDHAEKAGGGGDGYVMPRGDGGGGNKLGMAEDDIGGVGIGDAVMLGDEGMGFGKHLPAIRAAVTPPAIDNLFPDLRGEGCFDGLAAVVVDAGGRLMAAWAGMRNDRQGEYEFSFFGIVLAMAWQVDEECGKILHRHGDFSFQCWVTTSL